ncbi:MAG TPA: hypothetical protein VEB86_01625 [Chryseosolibacter sp.]|nr:hypothetical protein [Chryseosolibacter sp.]
MNNKRVRLINEIQSLLKVQKPDYCVRDHRTGLLYRLDDFDFQKVLPAPGATGINMRSNRECYRLKDFTVYF